MALIAGAELDYLPDGPDGFGYAQGGGYSTASGFDYPDGYADGYAVGLADGTTAGYAAGTTDGYAAGFAAGLAASEVVEVPDAIPTTIVFEAPAYFDHAAVALSRLCEFVRSRAD